LLGEVNSVTWLEYVRKWSKRAADSDVAQPLGLANSTVGRWGRSGPSPAAVRAFAVHYDRPVLEAFLAAGFLTESQASEHVVSADLRSLSDEDLIREVQSRMKGARDAAEEAAGAGQQESPSIGGNPDLIIHGRGVAELESRGLIGHSGPPEGVDLADLFRQSATVVIIADRAEPESSTEPESKPRLQAARTPKRGRKGDLDPTTGAYEGAKPEGGE
jgi:hypothetical protein